MSEITKFTNVGKVYGRSSKAIHAIVEKSYEDGGKTHSYVTFLCRSEFQNRGGWAGSSRMFNVMPPDAHKVTCKACLKKMQASPGVFGIVVPKQTQTQSIPTLHVMDAEEIKRLMEHLKKGK